jgi:hypothetical protein
MHYLWTLDQKPFLAAILNSGLKYFFPQQNLRFMSNINKKSSGLQEGFFPTLALLLYYVILVQSNRLQLLKTANNCFAALVYMQIYVSTFDR